MMPKTQAQFSSSRSQLIAVQDLEEIEVLDIEAVSSEEVFLAIRYLDPDLERTTELEVVSDEAVLLAIRYLDPDFR